MSQGSALVVSTSEKCDKRSSSEAEFIDVRVSRDATSATREHVIVRMFPRR